VFVLRLRGFAGPELEAFDGAWAGLAELGAGLNALRSAGCDSVCFAGMVDRPTWFALKPDLRGLRALPGAISAARKGDDGLLSFMIREFEAEGFAVEGAHQVMSTLTLGEGPLGRHAMTARHLPDVTRAMEAARAIGRLDIGQGAVACDGLVLALEAQEGTDEMLRRVANLPRAIRGVPANPRGVLVKASKPGQELRIDMPAIGPQTVRLAIDAGLAGIAGEAGRILLLHRAETVSLADSAGLFIQGLA
jgi:DUF1009 family protein